MAKRGRPKVLKIIKRKSRCKRLGRIYDPNVVAAQLRGEDI